ncbi:Glyceraldehyde-3-phosphate dehydrogenase (phosphorylating), partial [Trypanosoma cruzi]
HDHRADLIPLEIGGIALTCHADLLAVDDESAFPHLHHAAVATVRGVILQHVRHVIRAPRIVNAKDRPVTPEKRPATASRGKGGEPGTIAPHCRQRRPPAMFPRGGTSPGNPFPGRCRQGPVSGAVSDIPGGCGRRRSGTIRRTSLFRVAADVSSVVSGSVRFCFFTFCFLIFRSCGGDCSR